MQKIYNDMLRVGRISSINPTKGMARVTYEDRDNSVTDELPMLSFGFVYWMPRVGDPVIVLHFGNGTESGVILGRYYCDENIPPEGKTEFFRQEFERGGQSFLRHAEGAVTELYVKPAGLLVTATEGGVTIDAKSGGYKLTATAGGVQIDAASGGVKITGNVDIKGALSVSGTITGKSTMSASGDITAGSISMQKHVHGGVDTGSGTSGVAQ